MIPTEKPNQTMARELRLQLEEDEFIKQLFGTTLFRNISPAQMPLATLEDLSQTVEVLDLPQKGVLKLSESSALYEIISGYVKIYDRKLREDEKHNNNIKNPRALLAWRVPGEMLGDFRFAFPEEQLTDYIVATDACKLLKIPTATVHKLAQEYPQLYLNVARNLAAKAIKTRVRAQVLRIKKIDCMIAKLFIELVVERNYDEAIARAENLKVLNGTFYVEDIAAFLGYEYHSTQSGVRALIKDELVAHYQSNKSGRFCICDEERLHEYLAQDELN